MDITGAISPQVRNLEVIVTIITPDGTLLEKYAFTSSDGSYEIGLFEPDSLGRWYVEADFAGDDFHIASSSMRVSFVVNDTWLNQNKIYIIAAAGGGVTAVLVGFLAFRRRGRSEEE